MISTYVGGAFGTMSRAKQHHVLAVLGAGVARRPAKLALTRQQMFAGDQYRTPTIQHVWLGADARCTLVAIVQDMIEQTARFKEFAEQSALATRTMHASPNRRTMHRLMR